MPEVDKISKKAQREMDKAWKEHIYSINNGELKNLEILYDKKSKSLQKYKDLILNEGPYPTYVGRVKDLQEGIEALDGKKQSFLDEQNAHREEFDKEWVQTHPEFFPKKGRPRKSPSPEKDSEDETVPETYETSGADENGDEVQTKRKRGRPKGSKNKKKRSDKGKKRGSRKKNEASIETESYNLDEQGRISLSPREKANKALKDWGKSVSKAFLSQAENLYYASYEGLPYGVTNAANNARIKAFQTASRRMDELVRGNEYGALADLYHLYSYMSRDYFEYVTYAEGDNGETAYMKRVKVPVLDEDGNPQLDSKGKQIFREEYQEVTKEQRSDLDRFFTALETVESNLKKGDAPFTKQQYSARKSYRQKRLDEE